MHNLSMCSHAIPFQRNLYKFEQTLKSMRLLRDYLPTVGWLRGPAVEHWSLVDVLSLSCARLVADG